MQRTVAILRLQREARNVDRALATLTFLASLSTSLGIRGRDPTTCATYPVFINMHVAEVRIIHQFVGLYVDGRLTAPFVAHVPVHVQQTPELWTCNTKRGEINVGWRNA